MASALVTVVVTTKNSSRTLESCLGSIREQSYAPIELIVVDNQSEDSTGAIARAHADLVLDQGPERCAQRNAGLKAAHGEFVAFIDSDMKLRADVVSECVAAIAGSRGVAIPEVSFGDGFWARAKSFERSFYRTDTLIAAARFFRTADVLAAGGYDEAMLGGEDWDLSIRVCGRDSPAFASSVIYHDEGRHRLLELMRKKYYYGPGVRRFVRKHGIQGLRRITPLRGSLLQPRVLQHPSLAFAMFLMKGLEGVAALAGMFRMTASARQIYRAPKS